MLSDRDYLDRALDLARQAAAEGEVPVGAIVVGPDGVLATGCNQKEAQQDVTAHAEIIALKEAAKAVGNWRLAGCTLVSTLEPCPMCLGAALHSRVDRVVYGAKDLKWGACGTVVDLTSESLFNHRLESVYVPHADCQSVLTGFFKQLRST